MITKDEEWRAVPSAPYYEASSEGRIRRAVGAHGTWAGRVLKPHLRPTDGQSYVHLCALGKGTQRRVDRLVAEAFLYADWLQARGLTGSGAGFPASLMCEHRNGHNEDCRASNLRIVKVERARGGEHLQSKLAAYQVGEIRQRYANKQGSLRSLAKEFGVSHEAVRNVVRQVSWVPQKE